MYMFPFPNNTLGKYFCVKKPSLDLILGYSAYCLSKEQNKNENKMKKEYLRQMNHEKGYILYTYEFNKLMKNKETRQIIESVMSKKIDVLSFTNSDMKKLNEVISA